MVYWAAVQNQERFRELAAVIGFGPADEALLSKVRPLVEPGFGAMTTELLGVLLKHPPMAPLLNGASGEDARQRLQVWVEGIFSGRYDAEWIAGRTALGKHLFHAKLRLGELVSATSALRVRVEGLLRHATVRAGWSDHEQQQAIAALDEILDLELALILEGYTGSIR